MWHASHSRTKLRAACMTLLDALRHDGGHLLQTYPGRPMSLRPPTGFVDSIDETVDYTANLRQRHPIAQVVVVWGLFDSAEAVAQRDAFVDAWLDAVTDDPHAANVATLVEANQIVDEPAFEPDWG